MNILRLVGWDCRIHWLHLCRGLRHHLANKCPRYDAKQSDGETPDLEIWRIWSTPSLPLLSDPLWPGVVAPDRVPSMGQIDQTVYKQMTNVKLWLVEQYLKLFNCVQKRAQACLKMLSTKCVYKSYIISISMYKEVLALDNLQWLACHKTQPNQTKPMNIQWM